MSGEVEPVVGAGEDRAAERELRERQQDEQRSTVRTLVLDELLPLARAGLVQLEIDPADIDRYLQIIEMRVLSGQTGSAWQRAWVARYGRDFTALTAAYREQQDSGRPVHEWELG